MKMMCYQCEQTAGGTGCTVAGVCGKDAETSALQDLMVYAIKDISRYAHRARSLGVTDRRINVFTVRALFATLTNVNFDPEAFRAMLVEAAKVRDSAMALYESAAGAAGKAPDEIAPAADFLALSGPGRLAESLETVGLEGRIGTLGATAAGLQELVVYGLKGAAAYADHARILGVEDDGFYGFLHETLDYFSTAPVDTGELLEKAMECGRWNLRAMELLDEANTGTYGHPEPTKVRISAVKGRAILVSGHDLKDLEEILKQTEGKGINIYTHGEMLPAHAYPGLKKYSHLVGNYGGAWQEQRKEFDAFDGAILMTTNCLQKPRESYAGRIFTSGVVGFPGVRHIEGHDFEPVIDAALATKGFETDQEPAFITIGFARNAVLGAAEKVIELVKAGKIRHFFLIGGCDGAKPGRNYYTELAGIVPDDCVILTLACGKYRFNKMEFGAIDGIPRLLDCGQCNDAYSAVRIALALADAFGCSVNELPLSLVLSWYEQKAVAILLTLLHLGIKNIRIGPSLPAFVSPDVLDVLVKNFGVTPVGEPGADLAAILKT